MEIKLNKHTALLKGEYFFNVCHESGHLVETAPPADQTMEKVKKRYRKKKTKLEEAFPSYLQVAHMHTHTHTHTHAALSLNLSILIGCSSLSRRPSLGGIFWTRAGRWKGGRDQRHQVEVN